MDKSEGINTKGYETDTSYKLLSPKLDKDMITCEIAKVQKISLNQHEMTLKALKSTE